MDEEQAAEPCLILFCKRPALFQGKQRLAKTIGAPQALIFAQAFLNCALEDTRAWADSGYGSVVLSPASPDDLDWAMGLLEGGLLNRDSLILAQPEGGLGTRLWAIDQELRRRGFDKIIFMGSDAPMLKPLHFDAAARALLTKDIMLSPADDGGVTLMGSRIPWPDLRGLPWSTDKLGQALATYCADNDMTVENISPSYDIDIEADLLKLQGDLADDPRPARQSLYQQISEFRGRDRINYG
ncbi:hypothetical protein MNBD_ALPHA03-519 [hydrothermal vent metagenome]|uniref:Glycosyltransferase n=1 Tax=hydrothermal vent metagenome TaxID=652676 RepID=A0A3B1BFW2_9ZZZZ